MYIFFERVIMSLLLSLRLGAPLPRNSMTRTRVVEGANRVILVIAYNFSLLRLSV